MRALLVALVLLPMTASAQVIMAPAEPVPPAVGQFTADATHLLATGDPRGALVKLQQARLLVPASSWLRPTLDDLIQLAQVQADLRVPVQALDAASSEDVVAMYANLVAFGFWTGIWAFTVLGETSGQVAVPLSVVTAGGGAAVAYLIDQSGQPLQGGTAAAINFGLQFGTIEALLGVLATSSNPDGKLLGSVVWAGGAVGGLMAGVIASSSGASRGAVSLVYSGGLWGGLLGATLALAGNSSGQTVTGVALGGSLLGIASMSLVAAQTPVSRTRALFIDLGGLSGGLAGVGISALATTKSDQAAAVITATITGGLITAAILTSGMDSARTASGTSVAIGPVLLPPPGRGPAASGLALTGAF